MTVKFGVDGYTETFPEWAKHHKQISIPALNEDGTLIYPLIRHEQVVNRNRQKLIPEVIQVGCESGWGYIQKTRYLLPLKNLDYQEAIPHLEVLETPGQKKVSFRMIFEIEGSIYISDHKDKMESWSDYQSNLKSNFDFLLNEAKNVELRHKLGIVKWGLLKDQFELTVVRCGRMMYTYRGPFVNRKQLWESLKKIEVYQVKTLTE